MLAIEMRADRREQLATQGVVARPPEDKLAFLGEPMDALVLNASGGSLCSQSVRTSSANPRLKVVCGSENLVMPNPDDTELFRVARKAYCPPELGGMMGYLTAVEQYLAELEGVSFDVESLFQAASELEQPAHKATKYMLDSDFAVGFEEAVEEVCS
jgi:hypothetical protein